MASLVTGASGFLGGRVVQLLVERGEEVAILSRANSDLRHLASLPLRVVRGDLSDPAALRDAVAGTAVVYHCAACSTDWAPRRTYEEANIQGTQNLLAAASESSSLRRFLHVSTTDIYGYPLTPCGEDQPAVDAGLPYNQTKILGEAAVWRAYRERGLPVTVVRPATIYGPRGKDFTQEIATLLRQRTMAYIDHGAVPGGFTYVDTVAEAMMAAAIHPNTVAQAYNISGGTGASWKEYVTLFAQQLGAPAPWIDLSFGTAMGLARAMEWGWGGMRLRARPLLTRHAVYLLARNQEFPIQKAIDGFGYSPKISLEEGIRRSVEWCARRDSNSRPSGS
jgi:nucleoside-diphosphate-sugar epimerase